MTLAPKLSPQEVDNNAKQITALDLSQEDKALLLAGLYMANNRVEEATRLLEDLINNGIQSKGIYRILGDIYCCEEQHQLAKNYYEKALNLAANSSPCVERLAAKAGLALIEAKHKIKVDAKQMHQDIDNEFNTLASDRQESAIEAAIRNLSSMDMQLASVLTSLTTKCPVSPCTKALNGQLIKSHRLASCKTCISD